MTLRQQYVREFNSWRSARHRCTNPRAQSWSNYGGRGIMMCERWVDDFESFLADMGPCPAGRSLDRRDNARGYEPSNCRWATAKEQGRNTRQSTDRQIVNCIKLLLRQGVRREVVMKSLGVGRGVIDRIIAGQTWSDS